MGLYMNTIEKWKSFMTTGTCIIPDSDHEKCANLLEDIENRAAKAGYGRIDRVEILCIVKRNYNIPSENFIIEAKV